MNPKQRRSQRRTKEKVKVKVKEKRAMTKKEKVKVKEKEKEKRMWVEKVKATVITLPCGERLASKTASTPTHYILFATLPSLHQPS